MFWIAVAHPELVSLPLPTDITATSKSIRDAFTKLVNCLLKVYNCPTWLQPAVDSATLGGSSSGTGVGTNDSAVVLASTPVEHTGGSGVAQARLTAARQVVLQSAGAVVHDIAAFFSMDV